MKKILCPIDFSETALNGLHYAFSVAKKFKSQLVLFHAVHPHPVISINSPLLLADDIEKTEEQGRQQLEEICEKLAIKNQYDPINYMFLVKSGFAKDEIFQVIKENNIDLIITGTKGSRGIETIWGTLSSDLAIKASCPVIIVPQNYQYKEIKQIVYATDLEGEEKNLIQYIIDFGKTYQAHISILNIQKKNKEEAKALVSQGLNLLHADEYKNLSFHVLENEHTVEGISSFSKEKNAGLIVVAGHQKSFIEKIIKRSTTREISYHSEIPILALHKK